MIKMIKPETIAFMVLEVLEGIGGLDVETGKPLPGINWKVTRNQARSGGYNIEINSPMPARITMLPPPVRQ